MEKDDETQVMFDEHIKQLEIRVSTLEEKIKSLEGTVFDLVSLKSARHLKGRKLLLG